MKHDIFSEFIDFIQSINSFVISASIIVSFISGFLRGVTGFGSALVFMPIVSALYGPNIAAPVLLMIDFTMGLNFALANRRLCDPPALLPPCAAAIIGVPLGAFVLQHLGSTPLRWVLFLSVLAILPLLSPRVRFPVHVNNLFELAIGALSGFLGGALQIEGPLVAAFWLSRPNDAATVRANLMVFISVVGLTSIITYAIIGLITFTTIFLAGALGLPFALAMYLGDWRFRSMTQGTYRKLAIGVIVSALIGSLPIFDQSFAWYIGKP